MSRSASAVTALRHLHTAAQELEQAVKVLTETPLSLAERAHYIHINLATVRAGDAKLAIEHAMRTTEKMK